MKKFLIWTQYYVPEIGATAIRLHSVAKELVRQGYNVSVVTGLPNYPKGQIYPGYRGRFYCCEVVDGIRIHRCWFYPAREVGLGRFLSYLSFIITTFLVFLLLSRKANWIMAEVPPPTVGFGACIALPLSGAKLIVKLLFLPNGVDTAFLGGAFSTGLTPASATVSWRVSTVSSSRPKPWQGVTGTSRP